jgi:hypothetical protein
MVLTKEQLRLWTTLRSLSLEGLQIRLLMMSEIRFRFLLVSRQPYSHCLSSRHSPNMFAWIYRGSRPSSPPGVNARQIISYFKARSLKTLLNPSSILPRNKEGSHLYPSMQRAFATITLQQFTFKNYSSLPLDTREYSARSRHNFAALHKSSYVHIASISNICVPTVKYSQKLSQQPQQARTLGGVVLSNSAKPSGL